MAFGRWLQPIRLGNRTVGSLLALGLLFAGLSGAASAGAASAGAVSATAVSTAVTVTTGSAPIQCAQLWGCRKVAARSVGNGYTLAIYESTTPHGLLFGQPVLRLARNGVVLSWLVLPTQRGSAMQVALTCATTRQQCAVTGAQGANGGFGAIVIVCDGVMVTSPSFVVNAAAYGVVARDLDHDGYLDLAAPENNFIPNYAQGGSFWQTYRYTSAGMKSMGCSRVVHRKLLVPIRMQTGTCAVLR
jgi:hypothetical protein